MTAILAGLSDFPALLFNIMPDVSRTQKCWCLHVRLKMCVKHTRESSEERSGFRPKLGLEGRGSQNRWWGCSGIRKWERTGTKGLDRTSACAEWEVGMRKNHIQMEIYFPSNLCSLSGLSAYKSLISTDFSKLGQLCFWSRLKKAGLSTGYAKLAGVFFLFLLVRVLMDMWRC